MRSKLMSRVLVGRARRVLLLTLLLVVMVMMPLRSTFMGLVLPTPWADTDTVHLLHVVRDFQNFDLDSAPKRRDPVWDRVQVNLSQYDTYVAQQQNAYPEFWRHYTELKTQPSAENVLKERAQLLDTFQPLMNPREKAHLLFAFSTFHRACREAGLTYFILEASLMGVLRHHALIPWDDDIDVVMSARQWPQIRNVLGNIAGFTLYTPPDSQWKFYMDRATAFPNKPFKFPNIDIFFYMDDETHIWSLTKGLKHDLVYEKRDIFPLQLRPFEGHMVPVPCNLDLIVHKSHDQHKCVTPEYVHKTNKNNYFFNIASIDCEQLYEFYPFVFPRPSSLRGHVDEHLRVGVREIHKVTVPLGCTGGSPA
ncbi:uncharacterized protein LOC106014097 [Aplysia californica]|uniref:Uncharacterized protein LOC106014097 n=1 Tax=Aplysia californica TaxID=6500 RepID=A0ABM1AFD8_APLCA|nr:uncharacterized protein LOC106014097 [Aplysia californica]